MAPLSPDLRRELDKAISAPSTGARSLAEAGARAALARLGVEASEAPAGLSPELRNLRVALRERAKALGGGSRSEGIPLLVEEIAYEQWHRMLFARFLAENGLLFHPEGAPVSLAEVRELAAEEGERDPWLLAARYAAAMLPGIFRTDDPANQVALAPEDRSRLEGVLERLPATVFTSDDGLGWVYQFWQSERKDAVNKRGDKIGAAELPAVTQLFTEHYMVRFLLENSLGAWWAGHHPDSPLLREWEYLRFRDDGTPAAGTFESWPAHAADITVMDPCCGSGHFLVAAADMLRGMRIEEEDLSPADAAVAVIRDNLFGLELDPRCVQLAAFNLALDAWKAAGYQPLPIPNLACSGIAIKGQRADWQRLAGDDERMRDALDRLYDLFQDAPELGSLIDPRSAAGEGLWAVDTDALLAKLDQALRRETATDPAAAVFGAAAEGAAKAAQLLARRYWLVATNPPFLGDGRMALPLHDAIDVRFPVARSDLALGMLLRSLGTASAGALVMPQGWFFQTRDAGFRGRLFADYSLRLVARLGASAFSTPLAVRVALALITSELPRQPLSYTTLDLVAVNGSSRNAMELRVAALGVMERSESSVQRGSELEFSLPRHRSLDAVADALRGLSTGETTRFTRFFWEPERIGERWERLQEATSKTEAFGGRSSVILWEHEQGELAKLAESLKHLNHAVQSWRRGKPNWGRTGVAVNRIGRLYATLYAGDRYSENVGVITVQDADALPAVWAFCESGELERELRGLNPKLAVEPRYFLRVPFDLEHWQQVAAEQYPNGLPEPHSDDPTQWLFKGKIVGSEAPLQVAIARLLGYCWPDQEPDALDELADSDGLVPLVSVSGERPAAERLRVLLARAYGDAWSPALLDRLLAEAGSAGSTLETWLRDDFFTQHTKLFGQRPFIWHIWDGRRDGFSALCHYHRLDRSKLEKLTYTLLGDWIERQRAAGDEPGAEDRLIAAQRLQGQLARIIEGEAPYDVYVRWKSLAEQPIGWEPDLDDGVRLNIRPFVTAGVLRSRVNVKWDKDRGKNPDGSERINDCHPTLAEKRAARVAVAGAR